MTGKLSEVVCEAGITRASLSVQIFAVHCQEMTGREQSDSLICRTIDWLRDAGVSPLNFDLMYGLPHQAQEDLAGTLEYAEPLGADWIALFSFAHVPRLIPRQRVIDANALPGKDARFVIAQ